MPTRFNFPATEASAVNPAFDAGWEDTSEAVRRRMEDVKGADAIAAGTTINLLEDVIRDELDRQYVSDPMAAGNAFTTATTFTMQLMVREFALTDNVDRGILGVRIFSQDGLTLRATLLAVANYGPTLEFINNATMRNKTFADGDASTGTYTTVDGDRLIIEIGYQASTGVNTTPQAAAKYGQNAADLPVNETQTADGAGWFETSLTITFQAPAVTTRIMRIMDEELA